jgi:2,4-dienoyl-CoA reductase (NADPH2)
MHTRLECEPDGGERLAAFYAERARGGASLIVTGGVAPDRAGLLERDADALDDAGRIPFHRQITDAVHAAGARICYWDPGSGSARNWRIPFLQQTPRCPIRC